MWMNMEREGGPTPWLKALLSRVAKDTSGDEVLSLQGLEGKGDRVPIVWGGVCTRAGSSRWVQLDVQVGFQFQYIPKYHNHHKSSSSSTNFHQFYFLPITCQVWMSHSVRTSGRPDERTAIFLTVYLFICLSVYLFICLSVHLFICLSVYLFICLSV